MSWLMITIISGVFMGIWDVFKKVATAKASVLNVLALYSLFSFGMLLYDYKNALAIELTLLPLIALKTAIIFVTWTLSFTAIKHLPISLASPLRSLTPMFTIVLGIVFLHERLDLLQSLGIGIILVAYYVIGKVSGGEVTGIFRNKFLYLLVISTFLSALSGLMDKVILRSANSGQLQFWFMFMLAVSYGVAHTISSLKHHKKVVVQFNWSIVWMSLFIVVADRLYFMAMSMPGSQLSIIMPIRYISVIVSVIVGGIIFKEDNLKTKLIGVTQLLLGISLVFAG